MRIGPIVSLVMVLSVMAPWLRGQWHVIDSTTVFLRQDGHHCFAFDGKQFWNVDMKFCTDKVSAPLGDSTTTDNKEDL